MRLKGELQDETISAELKELFGNATLMPVVGYNNDLGNQLIQSSPVSFMFVMPMQILKNFLNMYYMEHVKPLLNDIVIEGYFNNPAYKSEFSSYVFALNESIFCKRLNAFPLRAGARHRCLLSAFLQHHT